MQKIDSQVARITKINNRIILYKFDVIYYRETDMKAFHDVVYYFIDDGTKIDHNNFINNRIMQFDFQSRKGKVLEKEGVLIMSVE